MRRWCSATSRTLTFRDAKATRPRSHPIRAPFHVREPLELRAHSLDLLENMEADGWRITMDKWTVGIAPPLRPVGVFALTRG